MSGKSTRPPPRRSTRPPPSERAARGSRTLPPSAVLGHPFAVKATRLATVGLPDLTGDELDDERSRTDQTAMLEPISLRTLERARFTVMTGQSAGMVIALERETTTIGRGKEADIVLDDKGVSRKHCAVMRTAKGNFLLRDYKSTNGTLVNGDRIDTHELRVGDRIQIGPNVVLQFALFDSTEEGLALRLYEASTRDGLTGAYNRKYFGERLDSELSYALRHKTALSVILFDLDHFKKINDEHGHPAGDAVLRAVADKVSQMVRSEDTFARYGGEEFVLLGRGIAHAESIKFAERLRRGIAKLVMQVEGKSLGATISVGVAGVHEVTSAEGLLKLADERLYKAKHLGRNRVCAE